MASTSARAMKNVSGPLVTLHTMRQNTESNARSENLHRRVVFWILSLLLQHHPTHPSPERPDTDRIARAGRQRALYHFLGRAMCVGHWISMPHVVDSDVQSLRLGGNPYDRFGQLKLGKRFIRNRTAAGLCADRLLWLPSMGSILTQPLAVVASSIIGGRSSERARRHGVASRDRGRTSRV